MEVVPKLQFWNNNLRFKPQALLYFIKYAALESKMQFWRAFHGFKHKKKRDVGSCGLGVAILRKPYAGRVGE
jgi:hypothetical protein